MSHSKRTIYVPVLVLSLAQLAEPTLAQVSPCVEQSRLAQTAATLASQSEFQRALAIAQDIVDPQERFDRVTEAFGDFLDGLEHARDQYAARLAVCSRLGGGPFAPEVDPQEFVAVVDNPFFPLLPGSRRSYRKTLSSGVVETIEIEVLNQTRDIMGVTCTVVRDVAREGGVVVEDTLDYYAQDEDGNVWYFGELSMNYEGGYLHDLDGSWIAGEGDAQPGVVMQATPLIGAVYRQEFALGEAEDTAGVVALGVQVQVPYGQLSGCLVTYDFTALEPEAREQKHYAPGIGSVLEVNLETGERLELVAVM